MTQALADKVLRGYGNASLQQMARARGLDVKGKGKDALVRMLAPTLFDPGRIELAVANLEPVERLLLDSLILSDGEAPTELLRRQLLREEKIAPRAKNKWGSYQDERGTPWNRGSTKFEDLVARLGVLGLVFTSGTRYGNAIVELAVPGRRLMIPGEILKHLSPVAISVEVASAPQNEAAADPALLLRDSYSLLSIVGQSPISLTVRGQIPKRALVQIDEAMLVRENAAAARSEDELDRLSFIRAILEDLALLVPRTGDLVATDQVGSFLDLGPGERLRQLYDAYRDTTRWGEIFHIKDLSVRGARVVPERAVKARRRVLEEVARMPTGKWIAIDHLVDRLRRQAYEMLFPRVWSSSSYSYYSSYDYQPSPYERTGNEMGWTIEGARNEADGWEKVEKRFIRLVISGPLHWLGAVDLGPRDGKPVSFRVTPSGTSLFNGEVPVAAAAEPHVVVQPNFQLLAFPPTGEGVLFRLDSFAERVRAEQVVEYRLTRESVYRGQRNGMDATAIIDFLERASSTPLPQNVRRTLEEWGALHDRIVVTQGAALLQAVDEAEIDRLYADPSLSPLLGRRISPTTTLVPRDSLSPLYQRLLESGRLPALTEGQDDEGYPLFSVDGSGEVTFSHRVPSIFARRALRPFAEEMPDGTVRLTPSSLREAARRGMSAEQIIEILAGSHAGPLSLETTAMVRRWAKDWGRGYLGEVVLLRVETPETLADLLADPEVGPHIQPVPGTDTLAIVTRQALNGVRTALEERGMLLDDHLAWNP